MTFSLPCRNQEAGNEKPRLAPAAATALAAALLTGGPATTAAANPATAARYAAGVSATIYSGRAFDTCTAPPLSTIGAWQASPYRALGIYIGGVDRHCTQPALTEPWVATVSAMGWRLIPVYKGLQAPCGTSAHKISPAAAAAQGTAAAADADTSARVLGLLSAGTIYNDTRPTRPATHPAGPLCSRSCPAGPPNTPARVRAGRVRAALLGRRRSGEGLCLGRVRAAGRTVDRTL